MEKRKIELYRKVMGHVRDSYGEEIEKAYEFFWEEDYPEDFLSGTALDLAFVNFEDWLVCDYSPTGGVPFIDSFREKEAVEAGDGEMLDAMKNSVISLYEVLKSEEGALVLKDVLLGGDLQFSEERLSFLRPGDFFGTRIIECGEGPLMGMCVYPFVEGQKDGTLGYIEKQLRRFKAGKNPEGGMRDFLKDESYMINVLWLSGIFNRL